MTESQDPTRRAVELSRTATGRYTTRKAAGTETAFGQGEDILSPVELLLAVIAGNTPIDMDTATSRSTEP